MTIFASAPFSTSTEILTFLRVKGINSRARWLEQCRAWYASSSGDEQRGSSNAEEGRDGRGFRTGKLESDGVVTVGIHPVGFGLPLVATIHQFWFQIHQSPRKASQVGKALAILDRQHKVAPSTRRSGSKFSEFEAPARRSKAIA